MKREMLDNVIIQALAKVSLIFFLYILLYYFFAGIASTPHEGDSVAYHIPIAKSIVDGTFIHPHYTFDHDYFPGSFESILAVFMFLHIPLNLYNLCAIISLFFATRYLAVVFGLKNSYAILFAVTICTLNVILRWIQAQTVDIWLGSFYIFVLALLYKPRDKTGYYVLIGFLLGMLIGTKYSGPLFVIGLLIFYGKNLFTYINFKRILLCILPILLCGIFWYIRNYIAIGNPFYPLDTPFFKGLKGNSIIEIQVWKTLLLYPKEMFDAFLGEYMVWVATILVIPLLFIYRIRKKQTISSPVKQLCMLSIFNFLIFLILPSGSSYQLHVSQYRFSYPVFIPLILCVFLFAKEYKKEVMLAFLSIASMFTLPSLSYHPKLLFLYIPLVYVVIFPDIILKVKAYFFQIIHKNSKR